MLTLLWGAAAVHLLSIHENIKLASLITVHLLVCACAPSPLHHLPTCLQVSSAACLMECVRSEEGPGTFTLGLYARLLQAALCSAGTRPEVLSLLVTKYMGMADVR